MIDDLDLEPLTLLELMRELARQEPSRFAYKGERKEDDLTVHAFEIKVEVLEDPSPFEIYADGKGGEIVNMYDLAMLNTLLELACQDHGWEVEMVMDGCYDPAEYDFDIYDIERNHLGSGVDSSREIAFLNAYLEAIAGFGKVRAMDA